MTSWRKPRDAAVNMFRATFRDFMRDDCPRKAAALAFYSIFALPPTLLIIVTIMGMVWGPEAAQGHLSAKLDDFVGPSAAEQLNTMIENANDPRTQTGWAVAIGIAGIVFAATGAFAQIQKTLNDAWNVSPESGGIKGTVSKRLMSLVYLLGLGILLVIAVAASTVLSAFQENIQSWISIPGAQYIFHGVNLIVSIAIFTVLFAAVYKFFPDTEIDWKDVWMGAVVTAILFAVGKFAIAFYLGFSDKTAAYGAAGSLAALLLWIYYSALIFLLGAEFTQQWWQHHQANREERDYESQAGYSEG